MQLTQVGSAESADEPDICVALRAPRRVGELVYSLVLKDAIRQRGALQDDLEKPFGRPVDLVPKEGLHRVIRDRILADAQVLYAA